MATKTILIKKYENRRLYDTTNSRYVNLDEVAGMLQRGDDVRVVDAATGEDITRLILTQIIVEDAKTPDSTFPLDFLRQMVIASGRASQEGALKYMKAMLDMYQNTYRAIAPPVSPFDFMAMAGRGQTSSPVEATVSARPDSSEVDDLKRRLADLEARLAGKKPRKTAKKAVRKKR